MKGISDGETDFWESREIETPQKQKKKKAPIKGSFIIFSLETRLTSAERGMENEWSYY